MKKERKSTGKKRKSDNIVVVERGDLEYVLKYIDEALSLIESARKYKCLSIDEASKLEKQLRKAKRALRKAHASLLGLYRKNGKTVMVDHIVVDKKGVIKHHGIHGLRGHDPEEPVRVQFKNRKGEPVEYEEIGTIVKTTRKGRRTYRKRTRRVKKAG